MCGRFVDANLRVARVDLSEVRIDPLMRRYNIKPPGEALILTKETLQPMLACWWLVPSWQKGELRDYDLTTFNARIEDAKNKPTFWAVWRYGPCLIPAGGYYEWTGDRGHKQPHRQ